MDENLVGYLLEALDPETHGEVEVYLRDHPEARARLERLERALAPLAADAEDPEPPPGLVLNTLARLAEHQCRPLPSAPAPSPHQVGPPVLRWFRRADLLVAAALLVVVAGLGGPFLLRVWRQQKQLACYANLGRFGQALLVYSDQNQGRFPQVAEDGAAGIAGAFFPILREAGVLPDGVTPSCPAQGRPLPPALTLAQLEQLRKDDPAGYEGVARALGGNYAYSLGYRGSDGKLYGLRSDSGDQLPILADCPPTDGRDNSPNHGGAGQNVLCLDGSVRFATTPQAGRNRDHIYVNLREEVLAGLGLDDTVLGRSHASPVRGAE